MGNLTCNLPPKPPPWRVERDVVILKALSSPAANTLLTDYSGLPANHLVAFVLCRKYGLINREPLQTDSDGRWDGWARLEAGRPPGVWSWLYQRVPFRRSLAGPRRHHPERTGETSEKAVAAYRLC